MNKLYTIMVMVAIFVSNSFTIAKADEAFMGFGVGVFNSAKHGYGEAKTYDLGARQDLVDGFYWQEKVGLWGIGGNPEGMKSSGYASTGLGFRVDFNPVEFHAGWSVAGITTPDTYLGGYFQFNGDLGFTLRDTRHGNGIGLSYGHISSAGIEMPNQGRDFVTLELSQRW
jgi:lipid A 3-O-deacylase PagL